MNDNNDTTVKPIPQETNVEGAMLPVEASGKLRQQESQLVYDVERRESYIFNHTFHEKTFIRKENALDVIRFALMVLPKEQFKEVTKLMRGMK